MATPAIEMMDLCKVYSGETPVNALRNASLEVHDNEFFTLLGPSGCGKSTLLRLVAGFETVTSGSLKLFGEEISALPPEKRPINTVFQHYSLFPHMTVLENVAFGLRRQGKSERDAKMTAKEMLDLVQLDQYAQRYPKQLSGGQQQRVALARALAPHPRVLLLDEPLSALDLKLRQSMRVELKRLQRETSITFVFVTHDQEEALAMSDRIAVLSNGRIQQVSDPATIYEHPENRFVADFIGDANFFDAKIDKVDGEFTRYRLSTGDILLGPTTEAGSEGAEVSIFFRPEKATVSLDLTGGLRGRVKDILYLGDSTEYRIHLADQSEISLKAENLKDGSPLAEVGTDVAVSVDPNAIRVLCR